MFDPVVHAALVTVFVWLINLLFTYLHIDLGGDVVTQLATLLVGYILSLFGYSVYKGILNKRNGLNSTTDNQYVPPFTS